jgi:hypothetical protein
VKKKCDVVGIFIAGGKRNHGVEKLAYSSTGRDLNVVSSGWQKGFPWKCVNYRVSGINITFCVPQLSFGSLSKDAIMDASWISPLTGSLFPSSLHCYDRKDWWLRVIYWWLKITQIVSNPIWYVRTYTHKLAQGQTFLLTAPPPPSVDVIPHNAPHSNFIHLPPTVHECNLNNSQRCYAESLFYLTNIFRRFQALFRRACRRSAK